MNDKILTVSIAAFNVERYLDKALKSCLPVMSDLDVIIVNDGSTDKTLAVAKEWEAKYPDSVRTIDKANGGYGSTFNASIPLARGKFFRYLDGDDWFDEDSLKNYITVLADSCEDAVVTPIREVYESGAKAVVKDCLSSLHEGRYGVECLPPLCELGAACIAYRTNLIRDSGFTMTNGCFYTDLEYAFIPFARARTVYVSHTPVYQYRIGREGQSISVDGLKRHHSDIIRVRMRLLKELANIDCAAADYLLNCLVNECSSAYRYLCICGPDAEMKAELLAFDELVGREYPAIYSRMLRCSKRVALLHRTKFLAWEYVCWQARKGV